MKSRLLTAQKKVDDVAFYLDQNRERKTTIDGLDKSFEIKAKIQEEQYNSKLMLSDEEKERVENEDRQHDQEEEDMEVNDVEQNID